MTRSSLIALALGLALALAAPLRAEEPFDPPFDSREDPRALALQGLERLMHAFESFVQTMPLYGLPEITEQGDIIIRRLPPQARPEPEPAPREAPELEPRDI